MDTHASKKLWYVYIVECVDTSLYTGITTDLRRRMQEHRSGIGAKYTRAHKISKLLYTETYPSRSEASKREVEIKQLSRPEKYQLVRGAAFPT